MTAVVILPGLDGTSALLAEFCESLSALGVAARAVAYPPDRPLGYEQLEALVRAQLPCEPHVLLGESFSGPLAIRIAAAPPPGLLGLVLSTTFARAPMVGLSPLAPLVRFAPSRPPMPILSWALLGPWATPQLRSQLVHALATVSPAVLRTRAAAAASGQCHRSFAGHHATCPTTRSNPGSASVCLGIVGSGGPPLAMPHGSSARAASAPSSCNPAVRQGGGGVCARLGT